MLEFYNINQKEIYIFDSYDKYEISESSFDSLEISTYSISIIYKESLQQIFDNVSQLREFKYLDSKETTNNIEIEIKKLSKYFKLYANEIIDENGKFLFLFNYNRGKFWVTINRKLKTKNEIFITGLHGIGKTISLIGLKYYTLLNINKFAYYNLDALEMNNNWKNIIKYETCFIFENIENFKDTFNNSDILNSKNYMEMIYNIIKYTQEKNYSKATCFIIDQFDTNQNKNIIILENIRYLFRNAQNGEKLIVCSTINDQTVRNDILRQYKIINFVNNEKNNYIYDYIVFDKIIEMETQDEKLSKEVVIFNKLPIFIKILEDIKDINKAENKIFQYIEKDLKIYWDRNNINDYLYVINHIQSNINKVLNYTDIVENEKYFSLKYFIIYQITEKNLEELKKMFDIDISSKDNTNFIIKYSFLFMEYILKKMKKIEYKKHLDNLELDFFQKSSEKGNIFEYSIELFFTENLLKCIFDGSFEKIDIIINIYNPFNILRKRKQKKKNKNNDKGKDKEENEEKDNNYINYYSRTKEKMSSTTNDNVILFLFDDDKAKRFDFLILIKKIKTAIGIQTTIHKSSKDLMPYYNKKTITNDFKEIAEEFKDVYNEDIQHFYLYFILCENYTTNDECIKDYYNYGINFFLFNPFVSKYKFKEINVENKSSINLEKIKFILDPSKDYGNINKIEQSIEDDLFKFNTYLFDYKSKIYKDLFNFKNKKKKEKDILVDKYIKDLYKNDKFNNYITSKYMANNYELIDVVELEKYIPSLRFDNDIFIRIIDNEEIKIIL